MSGRQVFDLQPHAEYFEHGRQLLRKLTTRMLKTRYDTTENLIS